MRMSKLELVISLPNKPLQSIHLWIIFSNWDEKVSLKIGFEINVRLNLQLADKVAVKIKFFSSTFVTILGY